MLFLLGVDSNHNADSVSVTEQPYKIPYYAALLLILHDPAEVKSEEVKTEDVTVEQGSSLGRQVLEDYWKGFQAFLDKLAWRETRLCVSELNLFYKHSRNITFHRFISLRI